ncbi:hypothetical protein PIIN_11207 [Serendipita indica DSM 11827]|uniref:Uncharacterized protein n=1 Tax=Serendipita indica (strain DSM 11827) TaxID=1109443 RepID=G4U0Y1_SERID|nr:hypothetical protein PIIN_11207 [Serendipita indica DSM 11827]
MKILIARHVSTGLIYLF